MKCKYKFWSDEYSTTHDFKPTGEYNVYTHIYNSIQFNLLIWEKLFTKRPTAPWKK